MTIVDCGELVGDDKLDAAGADFLSNYMNIPMNLTDMHMKEHEDDSDGGAADGANEGQPASNVEMAGAMGGAEPGGAGGAG